MLAATVALGACDDDGPTGAPVATALCATVQAWSDSTVDTVNGFRFASRGVGPAERRARYLEAFDELAALHDRLEGALEELPLPDHVASELDGAVSDVAVVVEDGRAEAAALPVEAYQFVAVGEGDLVTGVEKAKAIVFNTLADLSYEPGSEVPHGCGRRGALDLSPPATFPP